MIFTGHQFVLIVTLFLCLEVRKCITLPISYESIGRSQAVPIPALGASALIPFLKQFGYLRDNHWNSPNVSTVDHDHEMLYTEGSIQDAIREMQKFGALMQTGRLDNETMKLLTRPRCGVPDVTKEENRVGRSKRYIIGSSGWNKRRLTYRVENWAPQIDEQKVLSDIRKAFDVWADYARLRFINKSRWSQDDEADISISFGRGYHGDAYPFDGSGGILAHAFFPHSHGSLGGDIHFDLDENWTSGKQGNQNDYTSGSDVSFLSVAVHEIGHSLGLSHSPSTDSVMFPYYQSFEEGKLENVQLGYDDIMAMYRLYIQREILDFGDADENGMDIPTTTQHNTPSSTDTYESDSPSTTTYDVTTRANKTFVSTTTSFTEDESKQNTLDICQDGFDTMTFMRNELFVFKNQYMWRFREKGVTEPYYPVLTARLFPMLKNVAKIDAAFENEDGQLLFFSGKYYWIYDGTENHGPLALTNFGLPAELDKVDAAFIWNKNGKLYFFSNNLFWRYDTSKKMMDEGYPKAIERWMGLPTDGIDSGFKWSDGLTYFFKNDDFWRFDDVAIHTSEGFPMKTSSFWFGPYCAV